MRTRALTNHSSRRRSATRLNSGVRPAPTRLSPAQAGTSRFWPRVASEQRFSGPVDYRAHGNCGCRTGRAKIQRPGRPIGCVRYCSPRAHDLHALATTQSGLSVGLTTCSSGRRSVYIAQMTVAAGAAILGVRLQMEIHEAQLDTQSLTALSKEAVGLLCAGKFDLFSQRFPYAMAYNRPPAIAVASDWEASLSNVPSLRGLVSIENAQFKGWLFRPKRHNAGSGG